MLLLAGSQAHANVAPSQKLAVTADQVDRLQKKGLFIVMLNYNAVECPLVVGHING